MLAEIQKPFVELFVREKVMPIVEDRTQFLAACKAGGSSVILVRHCNVLELERVLVQAAQRRFSILVNMDHIDGINPDVAGLRYLAEHLHIAGITSTNPRVLAQGSSFGLMTGMRVFAADSTGLEGALEAIDTTCTDFLDVSPALAIPHIMPSFVDLAPLPFIASGLISTRKQVQATLHAGAIAVAVTQPDLWHTSRR